MLPAFFYSNLCCPSGIATVLARLCMQFADSAGNIADGALNQTNTFSFCIFRSFLLFSERGKELFHVTHTQTLMLHYL
jgi:hypothetical protein